MNDYDHDSESADYYAGRAAGSSAYRTLTLRNAGNVAALALLSGTECETLEPYERGFVDGYVYEYEKPSHANGPAHRCPDCMAGVRCKDKKSS